MIVLQVGLLRPALCKPSIHYVIQGLGKVDGVPFATDGLVCILSTIGTLWPEILYFKFQDQVKYLVGEAYVFCGFLLGIFWYEEHCCSLYFTHIQEWCETVPWREFH